MLAKKPMLACALTGMLVSLGCATMRQECEYNARGYIQSTMTRSTVVGTGHTELVSMECADLAYSTQDTGFSERAPAVIKAVGEGVGEGVAKGAVKGLTGGLLP